MGGMNDSEVRPAVVLMNALCVRSIPACASYPTLVSSFLSGIQVFPSEKKVMSVTSYNYVFRTFFSEQLSKYL